MRKMLGANPLARPTIVLTLIAATMPAVAAGDEGGRSDSYAIGHTTMVVTDTSRNPDGSTPITTAGRPLYLHIWYPTSASASQHIRYTWNNPVYNQNPGGTVYPGLPDTPAVTFTGSTSAHPIAEGAPLARGRFPFLVATHGYEVAAA